MPKRTASSSSTMSARGRSMSGTRRRQDDAHDRASLPGVRGRHLPAVFFDPAAHDGQTEPGPAFAPREEGLEDVRQVGFSEARTLIADLDLVAPVAVARELARMDGHRLSACRIRDRVVEQIAEHLLDAERVCAAGTEVGGDRILDAHPSRRGTPPAVSL